MQRLLVYGLLVAFLLLTVSLEREDKSAPTQPTNKIRFAIIESEFGGYGYNIYVNDKISIHQPHIPVISKTVGFAFKEDAVEAAGAVVKKMQRNEMPPAITLIELEEIIGRHLPSH